MYNNKGEKRFQRARKGNYSVIPGRILGRHAMREVLRDDPILTAAKDKRGMVKSWNFITEFCDFNSA